MLQASFKLRITARKLKPVASSIFSSYQTLKTDNDFVVIIRTKEARSIGRPPHSSASPVELRLQVGPRALSEKKRT
jgi:hypothetical protein